MSNILKNSLHDQKQRDETAAKLDALPEKHHGSRNRFNRGCAGPFVLFPIPNSFSAMLPGWLNGWHLTVLSGVRMTTS